MQPCCAAAPKIKLRFGQCAANYSERGVIVQRAACNKAIIAGCCMTMNKNNSSGEQQQQKQHLTHAVRGKSKSCRTQVWWCHGTKVNLCRPVHDQHRSAPASNRKGQSGLDLTDFSIINSGCTRRCLNVHSPPSCVWPLRSSNSKIWNPSSVGPASDNMVLISLSEDICVSQ